MYGKLKIFTGHRLNPSTLSETQKIVKNVASGNSSGLVGSVFTVIGVPSVYSNMRTLFSHKQGGRYFSSNLADPSKVPTKTSKLF